MHLEKFNNEITELSHPKLGYDPRESPILTCCHKDTGADDNDD